MRAAILLPVGLILATIVYMLAYPRGTVGQEPETRTATAPGTSGPPPSGPSGRLTYRSTGGDLVTVQFPEGAEVSRTIDRPPASYVASADGLWQYELDCVQAPCLLSVSSSDGSIAGSMSLDATGSVAWSPTGHTLAIMAGCCGEAATSSLAVIEHPADLKLRRLLEDPALLGFAWIDGASLVVSVGDGSGSRLLTVTNTGIVTEAARIGASVRYFYPSPAGTGVAFTVNDADGWRLQLLDTGAGIVSDLGNMGSDPAGITPPSEFAPEDKGPMYIAWSPDGTRLAFGGGLAPPYTMKVVEIGSGNVAHTSFPLGYPGEMKWSPDGTRLAVSTYDPERRHHETYVVDPATGAATFLMRGCIIVWSPDGGFLAVHGETSPGISLVDVVTGAERKLTGEKHDTPLTWEE